MRTDYKINSILRDGKTTQIKASIYEGEYQDVFDKVKEIWKVVYKRGKKLRTIEQTLTGDLTDAQIRKGLNTELATDLTREPIDEQKIINK